MSNDSNKEVDEIDEARDPHAVKMFKRANKEKREHGKDLDSIAKSGGPNMFVKRGAAEDAQDAAKKRAAKWVKKAGHVKEENDMDNINEFDTSAGNGAKVPDPVTKGDTHANRIADKGDNKEAMPKLADITPGNSTTPEVINYVLKAMSSDKSVQDAVFNAAKAAYEAGDATNNGKKSISTKAGSSIVTKEDISALFTEDDLTEEFKEKASVVFEAAVNVKAAERIAELEEAYTASLEEEIVAVTAELVEKLDTYLDAVADKWLEENRVEVEAGLKQEVSESFLNGLKALFEEHYVEVPADKTDLLDELASKVVDLEASLDEETAKRIEIAKKLQETEVAIKFNEISEGLTDSQKDKLKELSEAVDFANVEEFTSKVSTLKESVFSGEKTQVITEDGLNAGNPLVEAGAETKAIEPRMKSYVEALARTTKK